MARHRKHKKHSNPRKRRSSRRSRRSYAPNPLRLGGAGGALSALAWGGAGYIASKFAGNLARKFMPAMIPMPDLVAAAAGGAAVAYAGGMFAKSSDAKAAIRVGALIPTVEAAINMTSLGSMLGTQKLVMIAAPAGSQPGGVQAALAAALSADLRDDDMESDY